MKIAKQFNNTLNKYIKPNIKKENYSIGTNDVSFGGPIDGEGEKTVKKLKNELVELASFNITPVISNVVSNKNEKITTRINQKRNASTDSTVQQHKEKALKFDNLPILGNLPFNDVNKYKLVKENNNTILKYSDNSFNIEIEKPKIENDKIIGCYKINYNYKTERYDKLVSKSYKEVKFNENGVIKEAKMVSYKFKDKNNHHEKEIYKGAKFNKNGALESSQNALISYEKDNNEGILTSSYTNSQYLQSGRLKESELIVETYNKENPQQFLYREYNDFKLCNNHALYNDKITTKYYETRNDHLVSRTLFHSITFPNESKYKKYDTEILEYKNHPDKLQQIIRKNIKYNKERTIKSCDEILKIYEKGGEDKYLSVQYINAKAGNDGYINEAYKIIYNYYQEDRNDKLSKKIYTNAIFDYNGTKKNQYLKEAKEAILEFAPGRPDNVKSVIYINPKFDEEDKRQIISCDSYTISTY